MINHTPGPWEFDAESGDIHAPKCGYQWLSVCGSPIVATVTALDYNESGANGMLMAAAPELLDALKEMLNWWEEGSLSKPPIGKVRAVIAKAEG